MNLREMMSTVYSYIGSPSEEVLQRGECIGYLNVGQNVVARNLVNIEREKFTTTYTVAATGGTATYAMPVDLETILRIRYAGCVNRRLPIGDLSATDNNTMYRPIKGTQQFYYILGGTVGAIQIGLLPIPDDTANIVVEYIRKPTDFHILGSFNTVLDQNATEAHSATAFNASAAPFAGSATKTGTDDFWNNGQVRFTSGKNSGTVRWITDFDAISTAYGRFTVAALPDTPADADTIELDQVSIIPPEHHDMVCLYAAALAAPKNQMDPAFFLQMFRENLTMVRMKWTDNVEANLAGERPSPPPQMTRT